MSGVQPFCCSAEEVLEGMPQCFVLWQPSSAPSLSLADYRMGRSPGFLFPLLAKSSSLLETFAFMSSVDSAAVVVATQTS